MNERRQNSSVLRDARLEAQQNILDKITTRCNQLRNEIIEGDHKTLESRFGSCSLRCSRANQKVIVSAYEAYKEQVASADIETQVLKQAYQKKRNPYSVLEPKLLKTALHVDALGKGLIRIKHTDKTSSCGCQKKTTIPIIRLDASECSCWLRDVNGVLKQCRNPVSVRAHVHFESDGTNTFCYTKSCCSCNNYRKSTMYVKANDLFAFECDCEYRDSQTPFHKTLERKFW